jgi:positive regulator of sigma E activity
MTEQGTVVGIDGKIITLRCREEAKCQSCTSGLCGARRGRTITAVNRARFPLTEGDEVSVYVPTGKTIAAGFMVLIFPLLVFALFYFLSGPVIGIESEGLSVLAGFIGMVLGFLVTFVLGKIRKERDMPEILGLADEPAAEPSEAFEST